MNSTFRFHHTALSVSDIAKSVQFYTNLGFVEVFRYDAPDSSVSIVHMLLEGIMLELFCFASSNSLPESQKEIGNNLSEVGVKHIALQVPSIRDARDHLDEIGLADNPAIETGRTGIEYFFIRDPDGLWVEIVQDDRQLGR